MSKQVKIYDWNTRHFSGQAQFWGDNSNLTGNTYTNGYNASVPGFLYYTGGTPFPRRSRTLIQVDLSAIPRNSYIQSATFKFKGKSWDSGSIDTIEMAIYPCETTPWDYNAADMQIYDTGLNWQTYGLEPNKDYYGTYLSNVTMNRSDFVGKWYSFDVTSFIQTAIDRDDMYALVLLKPEDLFEQTNMGLDWLGTNVDPSKSMYLYIHNDSQATNRSYLEVVYTDPLAFFPGDDNGDIDESREIFLGAGRYRIGSVTKDPNDTAYQENPAKLFVKNQLANVTMKNVEIASPPNWANYPEPDAGNTGDGTCSDVTTSPTDTIDEQWEIRLTSGTAFDVYRDTGTGDEPGQTQTWTQDGSGTVGTQYSSATRGVSFTVSAGGTAFVNGDKFTFRTYKDYSIVGAPADSDHLLQICKDNGGSPDGNWYHARKAMTTLTAQVSGSSTLPVALAKYFNPSNKVKIFHRSTRTWSSEYTIQSVNRDTNQITLQETVTAESGDWLHAVGFEVGDLAPGSSAAFWARGLSFSDTEKEEKSQYLRAQEVI